jgi:hypothetical protein
VFDAELIPGALSVTKEHRFIDIFSDSSLEIKFLTMALLEFSRLLSMLILFASSCLCESGVSTVVAIKSKY